MIATLVPPSSSAVLRWLVEKIGDPEIRSGGLALVDLFTRLPPVVQGGLIGFAVVGLVVWVVRSAKSTNPVTALIHIHVRAKKIEGRASRRACV